MLDSANGQYLLLIAGVLVTTVIAFGVIWFVTKTIQQTLRSSGADRIIIVSLLTLVTLTTIIGYATTGLEDLSVLAGTGLGALAGAVTAIYSRRDSHEEADGE